MLRESFSCRRLSNGVNGDSFEISAEVRAIRSSRRYATSDAPADNAETFSECLFGADRLLAFREKNLGPVQARIADCGQRHWTFSVMCSIYLCLRIIHVSQREIDESVD